MLLQCHSYFSLKFGTLSPEHLLQQAQEQGHRCLALTDINNTSGIPDFFRLAPRYGIQAVAGIDFRNGDEHCYTGIARNAQGFYELNHFLSHHLHEGIPLPRRAPQFEHALVIYPFRPDPFPLQENEYVGIRISDLGRLRFSAWRHQPERLLALAPVTFRHRTGFNIHRLLRAMQHNVVLTRLPAAALADPTEIMLPEAELQRRYHDFPFLLPQARALLEGCGLDFEFGKNKNKKYFLGSAKQDHHRLLSLAYEGLRYRYQDPGNELIDRFEKEIRMITELGFSSYFLINHDIVRFARHKNFYYVGRGSGANSMVAYLLRITDVNPVDLDLYFERFINPHRTSPPDFDLDFSWRDRDEVIDYIFKTHGNEHTALLATYSEMKDNAVIRELGKVFGLPKAEIDALADNKKTPGTPDHITRLIQQYGSLMYSFPAHLGIHAGGILISQEPMHRYTATHLPPKNFPTTQFSMLEAEDLGLYKFDILSQRGLGKIRDAVDLVRQNRGETLDIHEVERFKQDEAIRKNLQDANLIGCFYVESPAMRMLLKKLRASTYLDLVAASSIIRPGVAQSGMMREYILRFHDRSRIHYAHPILEELLQETFGVMVYQEDVIKVAHHFGKLSLGEADLLRRGMGGKYKGRDEFAGVKEQFLRNCRQQGYEESVIQEIWRQMESFGGYAFAKGHSASYAVESYQCMFLKTYYPLEYMVAVLNNDGGFYSKETYLHEARRCGGLIHAPHLHHSGALSAIVGKDIYLGLGLVAELEQRSIQDLLQAREQGGPFTSLADCLRRVSLPLEQWRILIRCGAFRFTGRSKKQLLWEVHALLGEKRRSEARPELFEVEQKNFRLPPLTQYALEDAFDEIELLGFPLCSPFILLKEKEPSVLRARNLPQHLGKTVSICGYQVTRKFARTKHGQEMNFGTFLDADGDWIDTTHFPDVLRDHPFRGKGIYLLTGKVVEEFGFYSIDVTAQRRLDFLTRQDLGQMPEDTKTESLLFL